MVESIGEYILEESVSVRAVLELNVGDVGAAVKFFGKASSPFCIPVKLCISKQNLIKIYHAVQEL